MSVLTSRGERLTSLTDTLGGSTRVPSVNLLPPEIIERRVFQRTQKGLGAAILIVLLLIAGIYFLSVRDKNRAAEELAVSQATGRTLKAEEAKYADVPRVYQAIESAQTARQTAMSQDVEWSRYLTDFSLTMPANVWLTSLDMSLAGATPATPATTTVSPGVVTTPGIGTMTFAGTAYDHPDVAAWLVTLAKERAVTEAYFSSSVKGKIGTRDIVNFSSTASLTADGLSHRFDRKAG